MTYEGTLRRVLIGVYDWRNIKSCRYFRSSFVNCCPSNLFSGSPPEGDQTDKHLRKVPLQVNFLDDDILLWRLSSLSSRLYFLVGTQIFTLFFYDFLMMRLIIFQDNQKL
jgi:hypothetical protein